MVIMTGPARCYGCMAQSPDPADHRSGCGLSHQHHHQQPESKPGRRLVVDLGEDVARETVAVVLADLDPDCSRAWPGCPRRASTGKPEDVLTCGCRLRGLLVVNLLRATQGGSQ
jgi:hypothetical protein